MHTWREVHLFLALSFITKIFFSERAIIGHYTIIELEYAKTLGYSIQLYEVYDYYEEDTILKEFFQVLGRHKLRHSTSSVTTEMLKDMNKSMMIENTNLELKKTDFAKDEDQRNLIKLLLNSTIGKFASRPRVNTKFVNSKKEFYDVLCTEDVCLAEVRGDVAKLTVKERKKIYSSKGSMVITAYITARTRIMLHKYAMLIANSGYSLYYTDCDSLFFSGPKNQKVPLPVGTSFGDFKEVYKNIVSFSCVGRKRYCVTINEENKKKSVKKYLD